MLNRLIHIFAMGMLIFNLSGCFLFVAGVAGGAGTAIWLSGKLTQEFHATYPETINAAKSALQALGLKIVKETHEQQITQIKGLYSDGREMWIDIHRVTENSSKVEVRVGAISPDKGAASNILRKIQSYLSWQSFLDVNGLQSA